MLVFRVEDVVSGEGPYINYHMPSWSKDNQPAPWADGIYRRDIRNYHLFGFGSLEDLRKWFTPVDRRRILAGAGSNLNRFHYRVVAYEVPEVHVMLGRKQLIFDKHFAVKVGSSKLGVRIRAPKVTLPNR